MEQQNQDQRRQRALFGVLVALIVVCGVLWTLNAQAHSVSSIPEKIYHVPIINHPANAIIGENGQIVQVLPPRRKSDPRVVKIYLESRRIAPGF